MYKTPAFRVLGGLGNPTAHNYPTAKPGNLNEGPDTKWTPIPDPVEPIAFAVNTTLSPINPKPKAISRFPGT